MRKRLSFLAFSSGFRLRKWVRGKMKLSSIMSYRAELERLGRYLPMQKGVTLHPSWLSAGVGNGPQAKKVSCDILIPEEKGENVILYFHGGAYIVGSSRSHCPLVSRIAHCCKAQAYVIDYRLAPEHPYPAALEDAEISYRALLDNGISENNIIVMGDSAGGGLTLALLAKIKSLGLPMPKCCCLLSPWTNLNCESSSYELNKRKEVVLTHDFLSFSAREYMGEHLASNPFISPLFADKTGFPPIMIQIGSEEILLEDAIQFARSAQEAGVEVDLRIWNKVFHIWQMAWAIFLPAKVAIDEIAIFVKNRTSEPNKTLNSPKLLH